MPVDQEDQAHRYRVIQLRWDPKRRAHNQHVADLEDLVTHHPETNSRAAIKFGAVIDGESGRVHGLLAGEIEELEVSRYGRTFGLQPDQVLL